MQTEEGAFTETEHYPPDRPLHKPMDGRSRFPYDNVQFRNISLTAHVLISLEVTAKNLQVNTEEDESVHSAVEECPHTLLVR